MYVDNLNMVKDLIDKQGFKVESRSGDVSSYNFTLLDCSGVSKEFSTNNISIIQYIDSKF